MTNLPDALDGLGNVTLFKGWETRSRSSGGYTALKGIVVHHTASFTSTYNDTTYMWINAPSKPVGAIYLARNGEVVIGAAGATNCAGRGGPYVTSKGTIALDTANSNTISIEAGNAGTGEAWPTIQQDTYVALVAALCDYYKLDPLRDVMAHHEWAPTRKIDPAGSSKYAAGGNKWNMDRFRSDVAGVKPVPPQPSPPKPIPPPPTTEGDIDMVLLMRHGGTATANWGGWASLNGGIKRRPLTGDEWKQLMSREAYDGKTLQRVTSDSQVTWTANEADLTKYLGAK